MPQETDFFTHFIAGGVGGVCCSTVSHPFDTLRVRLQANLSAKPYKGSLDCLKRTITEEGFRGLYKGLSISMAGAGPMEAIFFGACAVGRWAQRKDSRDEITFLQNVNAGAFGGLIQGIIASPTERVRSLIQVETASSNTTSYIISKLYKEGGMRSLFCGTGITVLRYVSSSAVFLASYEDLKKRLSKNTPHGKLNWSAVTIAGGFAGVFAYGFCVPLDVIKSRLQTAPEGRYPNGCRDVIREISRSEGSAGFFRGFIPTILRAFPTNSACFCGFELTLYIFRRLFPER